MSLKFGIYLVEQKIVSPEQFCGLVKINQESVVSTARLSLQMNLLTIKQVSSVIDRQQCGTGMTFEAQAAEMGYLTKAEVERLLHTQRSTGQPLHELVVECGLLTEHQCRVLLAHFEKVSNGRIVDGGTVAQSTTVEAQESREQASTAPTPAPASSGTLRQPNFQRRPIIQTTTVES